MTGPIEVLIYKDREGKSVARCTHTGEDGEQVVSRMPMVQFIGALLNLPHEVIRLLPELEDALP